MIFRLAAAAAVVLVCSTPGAANTGADDVLFRSSPQWDALERIYRKAVTDRINEVSNAGTFTVDATMGYRAEVRLPPARDSWRTTS